MVADSESRSFKRGFSSCVQSGDDGYWRDCLHSQKAKVFGLSDKKSLQGKGVGICRSLAYTPKESRSSAPDDHDGDTL